MGNVQDTFALCEAMKCVDDFTPRCKAVAKTEKFGEKRYSNSS